MNGMSIGNIPFTAIAEYAKIYEVEDFDEFLHLIRVMDNKFLRMADGKREGKSNN